MSKYRLFYHRRLPHYQPHTSTLFVTFRLYNSLPKSILERLKQEFEANLQKIEFLPNPIERKEQLYLEHRRAFGRWDRELDSGKFGSNWLSEIPIAELISKSIHYRDGKEYDLLTFTILSNHIHIVFRPRKKQNDIPFVLQDIMKSLKQYTATEANRLLGRGGTFWQSESYDHVVRDADEQERIIKYVLNNPVKAGCVADWQDWPWTYLL